MNSYIRKYKKTMAELTENASENPNYRLPDAKTLKNACQISLTEDKPILMDYWANSFDQSAIDRPCVNFKGRGVSS